MTTARLVTAMALGACLALGLVAPSSGSPETDAFAATCNANPGFFSFAVTGLENDAAGLSRLCSCLVDEFDDYPEADLAMLSKDVAATSTPEERAAFGDYTGLEIKARDAVDACVVAEGLAPRDGTGQSVAAADMTVFDTACAASTLLLEVIGGPPEAATPQRTKLCACLVTALDAEITTADADILAKDLDGSATEASRDAYPGYDDLSETASFAFDGCFATLAPAQ